MILLSMLIISILVNSKLAVKTAVEGSVRDNNEMPGHLARRFQQIAVAVFLAEIGEAGFDLTPVQYAALAAIRTNPGIDQATLAGLIAYDRTTITGVVDRLVQKGLLVRHPSSRDRRARELQITEAGKRERARKRAGKRGAAGKWTRKRECGRCSSLSAPRSFFAGRRSHPATRCSRRRERASSALRMRPRRAA